MRKRLREEMKINKRLYLIFFIFVPLAIVFMTFITSCKKKEEPIPREVIRPVKFLIVGTEGRESTRTYPGKVRASQRVDLAFRVSGPLIELPVDEGQRIAKDAMIARILPRDFKTTLAKAKANALEAEQQYQRYRELYIKKQVSKADFDKYKSQRDIALAQQKEAEDALDDTYLRAPFTGVIAKRYVENYQDVQAKEPIVSLQDISRLEILVDVPESIMAIIKKKDTSASYAEFAVAPGKQYDLELKEYAAEADPKTLTYQVTLQMDAPEDVNILPGMTANVTGRTKYEDGDEREITIPAVAVFPDEGGTAHVWVINRDAMTVHLRRVVTGELTGADSIRIIEGLQNGETIAVSGMSRLGEGMKVRQLDE